MEPDQAMLTQTSQVNADREATARAHLLARLTRWAEGAGVITPAVGRRLRRAAASRAREAAIAHAAAGRLQIGRAHV